MICLNFSRYRTDTDVDRDRVSQGGLEERSVQFRGDADAPGIPWAGRREVQQEDRGDRAETTALQGRGERGWAAHAVPLLQEQTPRDWGDLR